MARYYLSSMDILYRIAMWISGIALLLMVAVIPVGIFYRYVLNQALSWPEPISILCMVTFTFVGAAVSYRAGSHIAVAMVTDRLPPLWQKVASTLTDLLMLALSLFILVYSITLCRDLWEQPVADFPLLTAGESYLPLPIGSAITLLFILERLLMGPQHHRQVVAFGTSET